MKNRKNLLIGAGAALLTFGLLTAFIGQGPCCAKHQGPCYSDRKISFHPEENDLLK